MSKWEEQEGRCTEIVADYRRLVETYMELWECRGIKAYCYGNAIAFEELSKLGKEVDAACSTLRELGMTMDRYEQELKDEKMKQKEE